MPKHNDRTVDDTVCHFCGKELNENSIFIIVEPQVVVGYCCEECKEADGE